MTLLNFKKNKTLIFVLIFTGILIFTGSYICVFKMVTGIPCAGCGMTRAVKYLVTFHFYEAFIYHPLVFLMPVIFIYGIYRHLHLKLHKYDRVLLYFICGIFISVWILRLIFLFPDVEPMNFDSNAVFPGFFK